MDPLAHWRVSSRPFREDEGPAAYAPYRPSERGVYLRQFFVWRNRRREGVGRMAFGLLRTGVLQPGTRIEIDVLVANQSGLRFWRSLGFRDYAYMMELL